MKRRRHGSPPDAPWKPTREQLAAAGDKLVPDVIGPNLDVLFVGINPGLYSGAIGHHFGRPGNRFWRALYEGGFTPRQLSPFEEILLLKHGVGLTNLCERTTARADELTAQELTAGAIRLARKVRRHRPRFVAVLGLTSYRAAFSRLKATLGLQPERIGAARLWLLPNPSGLNAHHQPADLKRLFRELSIASRAGASDLD